MQSDKKKAIREEWKRNDKIAEGLRSKGVRVPAGANITELKSIASNAGFSIHSATHAIGAVSTPNHMSSAKPASSVKSLTRKQFDDIAKNVMSSPASLETKQGVMNAAAEKTNFNDDQPRNPDGTWA